jgi:O-antigen ligase
MEQSWFSNLSDKIRPSSFPFFRTVVIVLAIFACLIVGISGYFISSPYAPLLVGAAYAGIAVVFFFLRKPIWAVYTALFFIFLPLGLLPATTLSNINRVLSVGAFAVWLIDVIVHHRKIVWTSTHWAMAAFLVWCVLTYIWAADRPTVWDTTQVYALRFLFFLMAIPNLVRDREDMKNLLRVLAFIGWFLIVLSLAFPVLNGGYTPGTRLKILDSNQNTTGIVLLMAFPGVLWHSAQRSQQDRRGLRSYGAIIFLLLSVILTFMSGSRGSTISLAITLALFYFFKPTRYWTKVSLIVILLALVVAPFAFNTIVERFKVTPGDTALGGREVIWQAGLLLIRDHPWLGVGIGNSPYAVLPYLRNFQSLYLADPYHADAFSPLHNPVLVILSETGLPGLLIYLMVPLTALFSFLKSFYQAHKENNQAMLPYYALILPVFVGYMASWIKGGGMESDYSYFLLLALLLIPANIHVSPSEAE